MARPLVLDESLPDPLAAELRARGHDARTLAELGVPGAGDAEVLAAAVAADGVLVTGDPHMAGQAGGAAVAVVAPPPPGRPLDAWRRDVVHRWAPEMARRTSKRVRSFPAHA